MREREIKDVEVTILKNRLGRYGQVPLKFDSGFSLYTEDTGD